MQILQKRLDKLLFLTLFVKENQGFHLGFLAYRWVFPLEIRANLQLPERDSCVVLKFKPCQRVAST